MLSVARDAPADDIKKAFRREIARYHPDKVQHLGKEFQDMAAGRASELNEAHRVLSNEVQRAEYDRALAAAGAPAVPPATSHQAPGPPSSEPSAQPQAGAPQSRFLERSGRRSRSR